MARTPLPEELQYLEPFRKQTAKMRPEEIDEGMDLSLLNGLLLERIRDVSVEEGKRRLVDDQVALDVWLASPNINDNGGMFFLKGYLLALPGLVDRLLEEKAHPKEVEEIEMEVPPDSKVKKHLEGGGGWQISWKGAKFFVIPHFKKQVDKQIEGVHPDRHTPDIKYIVTKVVFGKVSGYKCLRDASMFETMNADYTLEVPGGVVQAMALKIGNHMNAEKFRKYELEFEKYLHTIRIVRVKR